MFTAFAVGVVCGIIGLVAGFRVGYGAGWQDGEDGWFAPWPWSEIKGRYPPRKVD